MTTLASSLSGVRIDNKPVEPQQPWAVEVTEPATGAPLFELTGGAEPEANAALDAAERAFDDWSKQSADHRAGVLRRIAADLRDERTTAEIAELITRETGKRLAESRAEVGLSAKFCEWFADAISGASEQVWSVAPGVRHNVLRRPPRPRR